MFFGPNFITVTRSNEDVNWSILKPEIYEVIQEFFSVSNLPILTGNLNLLICYTFVNLLINNLIN